MMSSPYSFNSTGFQQSLNFFTTNFYFSVIVAGCVSQYFSLRDTGRQSMCVHTWYGEYQDVCTCTKMAKWNCYPYYVLFNWVYVCLPEPSRGFNRPITLQGLLKKSILLNFLVGVAQFSIIAHEKPDSQVLKEAKSESSDYSWMMKISYYGKMHVSACLGVPRQIFKGEVPRLKKHVCKTSARTAGNIEQSRVQECKSSLRLYCIILVQIVISYVYSYIVF